MVAAAAWWRWLCFYRWSGGGGGGGGAACTVPRSGEFSLLAAFVQHPHRPLSRERLIELARGPGSDTDSRSMDVQVSRVRKLVEPDPARPRYIQTVWGYGYVFVPDGQPRSR